MAKETIVLERSVRHQSTNVGDSINNKIKKELQNGNPVYVKIPLGVFAGSIARLKITKPIDELSRVLTHAATASTYGPKMAFRKAHWEVEIDGCNRKFKIDFDKFSKFQFRDYKIEIYLGRTEGTFLTKKKPAELSYNDFLIDMFGRKINPGDFVLINPGPAALQNDEAVRLVQWTGNQTPKQAYFKVVKTSNTLKKQRPAGEDYRLGVQYTDDGMAVPGIKIDVDDEITSALTLIEHDITNFKLKFSVGLDV